MFAKKLDEIAQNLVNEDNFSGVVLLRKGGKDVYSKGFGLASRSWEVPNSLGIRFPHASVTKMFTAVSVLQLVEKKAFALNTKVGDYLGLKGTRIPRDVSIFHLLTHTSGIGDYLDEHDGSYEDVWAETPNYSIRMLSDTLPLFVDKSPVFDVGTKFRYCDAGYILLGVVVEKASGVNYFDYVKKNIFLRAGMKNSDFVCLDSVNENVAECYIPVCGKDKQILGWRVNIYAVPPCGASDGGAVATAHDLARFMEALRGRKLLTEEMTDAILSPHVDDEESDEYVWKYGYGIWVTLDKSNTTIRYGHPGEDPGVSARVYYYPSHDIDVVILGNQTGCAGDLSWKIHKMIMEGKIKA